MEMIATLFPDIPKKFLRQDLNSSGKGFATQSNNVVSSEGDTYFTPVFCTHASYCMIGP